VQIATHPIESPPDRFDVFVALDRDKLEQFRARNPA
jgi:hypothetical protein